MSPREARRERRADERKAKKVELKKARLGATTHPPEPRFDPDPRIQPRWNAELEDEFPCEVQIHYNAEADRRSLEAGLPLLAPNPGSAALLAKVRERLAQLESAPTPETNNGFVSQKNIAAPKHTTKRAEVNRQNAAHSTGPKSIQGKMASSRNSTQSAKGAAAQRQAAEQLAISSGGALDTKPVLREFPNPGLASGQPIIQGEDPAAFDTLLHTLMEEHQPATPTEELLIKQMAQSHWLTERAIRLQNECFTAEGVNEKQVALFLRYQTTHQRAFYRSLSTLLQLKKARAQRGFVSQPASETHQFVRKTASESGFVSQMGGRLGPPQPVARKPNAPDSDQTPATLPQTRAA